MLTVDERLAANSHERAVGSRVSGHFDHTANNITGPYPQRPGLNAPYEESENLEAQTQESDENILVLACSVDEETGEWVYEDPKTE
ncbi:MAG: hypothetical protein AB2665_06875 [Candidatus Thiodiazotropha sp.]